MKIKKNLKLSQYNVGENKGRAITALQQINELRKKGIRVEISQQQAEILMATARDGFLLDIDNTFGKYKEYSASNKEFHHTAMSKRSNNNYFFNNSVQSSSSSSVQSATSNNNNSAVVNQNKSPVKPSTSQMISSTIIDDDEKKKEYTNKNTIRHQQSKIRSEVKCNLNMLNQFLTLFITITTSEEYKTTNIKEFRKLLDDYFKSLSKDLKKVTVKHKNDKTTYTYENFSVISVIGCTERGYLHCHCLLVFEGVITKIAPKKLENGATGFDFDNNIFKSNWKYGNVYIEHYMNGLDVKTINNVANYFAKNYQEIREIKNMNDEELSNKAKANKEAYQKKLSADEYCRTFDVLAEECYNNLLDLREQQADGKRNKIYYSEKIVLEEDLTISDVEYKDIAKYLDNMAITEQEIRFRLIAMLDDNRQVIYRLQTSIRESYVNDKRTYSNSLNIFSKEEYRRIQRMRRNPVAVVEQEQEQQRCNCVYYDEEYKEELCYLYSDEEDMLLYEEMLSGMVLA